MLGYLRWQNENAGFIRALRQHYRHNPPDTIVAWMPPAFAPCLQANEVAQALLVASTHNEPSQDYTNPERWDPSVYDRKRRLAAVEKMDNIIVLLDEYKKWYQPAVQPKIKVIANVVQEVDADVLKAAQRKDIILAVGRLATVKRHDLLIRSWARIAKEFPGWSIRIFGEGPERAHLATLIDDLGVGGSVKLMGHTSEIKSEYLRARLLCHPAEFEGFPLAVTEALAHGLPVVGFSDCSGLNALVKDCINGRLMRADDDREATLAATLRELLPQASVLKQLGQGGPPSMRPYSPITIYDEWERLLLSGTPHLEQAAATVSLASEAPADGYPHLRLEPNI